MLGSIVGAEWVEFTKAFLIAIAILIIAFSIDIQSR